tara:strand:- start:194 stop:754 length:561 start_codon:yes stop_codon:yes gene_type:complete
MGRSTNRFTALVGRAAEINEDKVTLPEKDLWVAVLCRAVLDACKGPPHLDMSRRANISHKNHYNYNRDQARHFFLEGGSHFNLICELAGRDPSYVQQQVRKIILRKNGWNIDVPITSHYRQGPKIGNRYKGYQKWKWGAHVPASSREKLITNFRRKRVGRPRKKKLTGNSYYAAMGKKGGRPKLYG